MVRGNARSSDRDAIVTRLRLHIGTVLSFLLGGVLGVLAWRLVGDLSFAFAGLLLAVAALGSIASAFQMPERSDTR